MKIVILAGGRGTRLKPITDKIPKVLVSVFGEPFLQTLLNALGNSKDIILLTGYKSELIEEFCRNNNFNVKIIEEKTPLGTGGALAPLANEKEELIVLNGDTYVDIPFEKLLAFHRKRNADVTLLAYEGILSARGAITHDALGKVTAFGEKISESEGEFSTGVYVIRPNTIRWLIKRLPKNFSMEHDGFPLLIRHLNVYTYVSAGKFFDMGTHESLATLRRRDDV